MPRTQLVIALVAFVGGTAAADVVTFFDANVPFNQFNLLNDKLLKGVEDFEESTVQAGAKVPFPNSLQNGVPRPTFDNGINATNLIIQTNITAGASPPTLNPSTNAEALWVNGPGFLGSNSVKIGNDEFLNGIDASLDLIFTSNDKTGIGFDVSTYDGFNAGHTGFTFTVYDQFNNVLGTHSIGATVPEPSKTFFGVWSSVPIGRVNVFGHFSVAQPFAVDNIEMWVPAPGSAAMLAFGALAMTRRRR